MVVALVAVGPRKDRTNQSAREYQRSVANASFNMRTSVHGRTAPCRPLLRPPIQRLRRPCPRLRQQSPRQLADVSRGVQPTLTRRSASGLPAKLVTCAEVEAAVPGRLLLRPAQRLPRPILRLRQQIPLHQSRRNPQPQSPLLDVQVLRRKWGARGFVVCKIWLKARRKTASF